MGLAAVGGEPLLNKIVLALIMGHVGQWERNRQYLTAASLTFHKRSPMTPRPKDRKHFHWLEREAILHRYRKSKTSRSQPWAVAESTVHLRA
jgi:hypothetical protein